MLTLKQILGRHGALAACMEGYEYRPSQIAMAKVVNRGLLEQVHVMVEAATGTGKSFGYLVPALLSGQRVVISTATLALQEQLLFKDIPRVLGALGSRARVVALKGRNNYLCRDKVERLRSRFMLVRTVDERALIDWSERTATGDRAELDFVPSEALWQQADADIDDCIMDACEFFGPQRCHHMQAREAARHADIVVVNHALFFSDLASGGGTIPAYDYAILDEAHQIEEWATAAFTSSISRQTIARLSHKLARAYVVEPLLAAELQSAAETFLDALDGDYPVRYRFAANERAFARLDPLQRALYRLENWLADRWRTASRFPAAGDEALTRRRDLLLRSIVSHAQTIERLRLGGDEWICWAQRQDDARRSYGAHCAPAGVSDLLKTLLFERARSVVMTSATISTAGTFSYLRRQVGLQEHPVDELILPSPFDFVKQALLYLPPQRLDPRHPAFGERAAPCIEDILEATAGRAFVLFTSIAMMQRVAELVRPKLSFPARVQGDAPKGALLRWFRSEPNAVLFATASFWEGVDVIGEALSCVVIDRLPFPPPDDPLVEARSRALLASGRDPFCDLMVPAAITKLKQGLGRLIRSTSDRGLMCILDGRLQDSWYGRRILEALPPARRVHSLDDVRAFLQS